MAFNVLQFSVFTNLCISQDATGASFNWTSGLIQDPTPWRRMVLKRVRTKGLQVSTCFTTVPVVEIN